MNLLIYHLGVCVNAMCYLLIVGAFSNSVSHFYSAEHEESDSIEVDDNNTICYDNTSPPRSQAAPSQAAPTPAPAFVPGAESPPPAAPTTPPARARQGRVTNHEQDSPSLSRQLQHLMAGEEPEPRTRARKRYFGESD